MGIRDDWSERLRVTEARIDWVLEHPDMSDWLKQALRTARGRDPSAVLNDLEMLRTLLQDRSGALIKRMLDGSDKDHASA